jgi:hypothetical protein
MNSTLTPLLQRYNVRSVAQEAEHRFLYYQTFTKKTTLLIEETGELFIFLLT